MSARRPKKPRAEASRRKGRGIVRAILHGPTRLELPVQERVPSNDRTRIGATLGSRSTDSKESAGELQRRGAPKLGTASSSAAHSRARRPRDRGIDA